MKYRYKLISKAFTLAELLVVISIIALLMAILLPVLAKARMQAKIVVVNSELRQVSLALGLYYEDNKEYPPTMADCGSGMLKDHMSQLPKVLADNGYLPAKSRREAMKTIMEDPFNPGHTYKYNSCGEIILDRDKIENDINAALWIPDNFPAQSSLNENDGKWYDDIRRSPVLWVVYSLGPNFNQDEFLKKCNRRFYPVPKEMWYSPKEKKGLLVRLRLDNGREIGSFEGY